MKTKIQYTSILFMQDIFMSRIELSMPVPLSDDSITSCNQRYGPGGWVAIPSNELPSDFSELTYAICKGELVRASAELVAGREAKATQTHNEQQRLSREAEYRRVTDIKVMELISEANPEIAAIKATIREKYPYK